MQLSRESKSVVEEIIKVKDKIGDVVISASITPSISFEKNIPIKKII
jgi:hypothetical protein